jgi:hypothetical protein
LINSVFSVASCKEVTRGKRRPQKQNYEADTQRKFQISQDRPALMNTILITAIVSACLLAAVWIGMWLRRFFPEHHVSPHSRDSVKLAMGLVATMSALLKQNLFAIALLAAGLSLQPSPAPRTPRLRSGQARCPLGTTPGQAGAASEGIAAVNDGAGAYWTKVQYAGLEISAMCWSGLSSVPSPRGEHGKERCLAQGTLRKARN